MGRKVLPPAYFLCAIVLTVLLWYLVPVGCLSSLPLRLVGLLPIIAGVAMNLSADRAFKTHQTTVKPFEESTALVTRGAFSISRNPMYLGMVLILLGLATALGCASALAVVPPFALLLDRAFIAPEERMLEQKFGEHFRDYRRSVRRWV